MVGTSGRVDGLTSKRVVCSVGNNTIYSPPIRRGVGDEASLNTEYTDSTKPEGDTEFLKEHGNPQKQTPKCNSKFKVHNSKL